VTIPLGLLVDDPFLGVTLTGTVSKEGGIYLGAGPAAGLPVAAGASLYGGTIDYPNQNATDRHSFISAWSTCVAGGFGGGVGGTWGRPPSGFAQKDFAYESGLTTPGVIANVTYSMKLGEVPSWAW